MDPRAYFNQECYALRGCLHCGDCLAFALRYFRSTPTEEQGKGRPASKRTVVVKFINSVVASENLSCEKALRAQDLREYVSKLLDGQAELPACHYDLGPEAGA